MTDLLNHPHPPPNPEVVRLPSAERGGWPGLGAPPPSPLRTGAARLLLRRVAGLTGVVFDLAGVDQIGHGPGPAVLVHRPDAFLARLGRDGKIGFGESYMAGDWDPAGDLADLLTPMGRRMRVLVPTRLQWLRRFYEERRPAREDNDPRGAKRNVAHHYDLSNALFALFLDQSMSYSSALFETGAETLEHAQARKIERILDRAGVGAGCTVLEIGSGWGELAIRAARRGATVTTLTLSREQACHVGWRVAEEGLTEAVDVRLEDYRESAGVYDAVVSVEMIEAVGERWWPTYFQTIDARLAPGGKAVIQSILMDHDALVATRRSWTWIHKYVFPGGIIPSTHAIEDALSRHTGLEVRERLHFGDSYAKTLRRWRSAFDAHTAEVAALGFDDVFRRMWDFYLAYSEAGFRSGYLDVGQLVLSR